MKITISILLCISQVLAGTIAVNHKYLYHRGLSRSFGPELTHRNYKAMPFKNYGTRDPMAAAIDFAQKLTLSDFEISSAYSSDLNNVIHVYLRQKIDGLEVLNGDMNINVDREGQIISYGSSFTTLKKTPLNWRQFIFKRQVIRPEEALKSLLAFVHRGSLQDPIESVSSYKDGVYTFNQVAEAESPVEVKQGYLQLNDGELQLVWNIEYELQDNWYNSQIHAYDGTVLGLVDWVSSASYKVIPFGYNDPNDGPRKLLKDPHDVWASPHGWNTENVTLGNNVYTHTNPDGGNHWKKNHRPTGRYEDGNLVFDYPADFDRQEPEEYQDAAVTNLFYWCNIAHDFFHRYGFDEKAGNFQQSNLGRGRTDGGDSDAVIANAQDGSGRNNANFATPPDGKHGKMRMYIWDQTKPMRDGDFESGIVVHEYTHGVSIRLTGGPKNSNCLGWGEAGGMGEGWGDFIATVIRMNPENTRDDDFGMGDYANGGEGIRNYMYSTSLETNPSTYKIMDGFDYWGVHAKGEVWAEMLYEVYWNLVDRLGFTSDWFPPTPQDTMKVAMDPQDLDRIRQHITSHGNTLAVQLVMDGLKLQPCMPSFLAARDAILEAERLLTGGEYHCDIYKAFAKRGLGVGARLEKKGWLDQRVESYEIPSVCSIN
ncbi:unnamed protein product [Rhizopus stolonifer]